MSATPTDANGTTTSTATPAASSSAAPRSPPAKLTKADLVAQAKQFHRTQLAARAKLQGDAAVTPTCPKPSASGADPVEQALKKLTSSSQSYDAFVSSLGGVDRLGADGMNELSRRAAAPQPAAPVPPLLAALAGQQREAAEPAEGRADPTLPSAVAAPTTAAAAASSFTPATASPAPSAAAGFGSDFLMLMRMLAEDKERMRDSTAIITGDEATDAAAQSLLLQGRRSGGAGAMAAAAAGWHGDHIRVDDSYGFAPDPFAPEARTLAAGEEDEEPVDEQAAAEHDARIRVLGEGEDLSDDDEHGDERKAKSRSELNSSDDEEGHLGGSRRRPLESGLFLSEEEAGGALESVPVEADYRYEGEKDNLTVQQFREQQQRQRQQAAAEAASAAPAKATADATLPAVPPSQSDRAVSRLDADAAVAARAEPVAPSSGDDIEAFSYRPSTFDPNADEEHQESAAVVSAQAQTSQPPGEPSELVQSGTAVPAVVELSSTATLTPSHSRAPISPGGPMLSSFSRPPAATSMAAASADDDDGLDVVELEEESSTSVPVLSTLRTHSAAHAGSNASTSAADHHVPPPRARHGNFLDASTQMGFEQADEQADVNESDDDADWLTASGASAATSASAADSAASSYLPSASRREPRRTLPTSKTTGTKQR